MKREAIVVVCPVCYAEVEFPPDAEEGYVKICPFCGATLKLMKGKDGKFEAVEVGSSRADLSAKYGREIHL
ncbi:MAG: lysine biosynthesis protein [bacterium]